MASPPTTSASRAGGAASEPLIGLDLLRFAAAVLVMSFHLACTSWIDPMSEAASLIGTPIPFPSLLPLSSIGWIGVPIFFVISGYVIAYSASHATASTFLVHRILRLMPGVWFCATVSFALALVFAPEGPAVLAERYLRTLVLFPTPRWIDGVYWTLGIEISFYALVYALLRLGWSARLERIVVAVGIVAALLWCLAATPIWPGLDRLISTRVAKLALITNGADFAIGVLLWSAARNGWSAARLAGLTVCLAGAVLQIRYEAVGIVALLGRPSPNVVPIAAFLGFLVLCAASIAANARLVARWPALGSRLRHLGLATYPLYLLHTLVGILTMRLAAALGLPPAACLAAGFGVAVAAGLLVARYVEPPMRRALRSAIEPVRHGVRPSLRWAHPG